VEGKGCRRQVGVVERD